MMEKINLDWKNWENSSDNEISIGWDKLKGNFLTFFVTVFLLILFDSPFDMAHDADDNSPSSFLINALGVMFFFLIRPILEYGGDWIFVKGVRNEKPEIGMLFLGFKTNYKNIVLTNLLVVCLVALSFMLLIIPGIIVACKLVFTSYLVMDKNMQPLEAVETSWEMTKGKEGRIFVLGLGAIFITFFGVLFFIVGMFPAVMWIKSYFATYYQIILNERGMA